ncbi:hypothetical protein Tco_0821003 [Tanacetum coccineum]|uniref:Uncharacterized protein n=1 Tax=Tanacetum coccineum TaxID=301880 RepID=A0ABQ5AFC2_9ASTR
MAIPLNDFPSRTRTLTGQKAYAIKRLKFQKRKNKFKGRRMLLVASSNGSADEQERQKLCKACLGGRILYQQTRDESNVVKASSDRADAISMCDQCSNCLKNMDFKICIQMILLKICSLSYSRKSTICQGQPRSFLTQHSVNMLDKKHGGQNSLWETYNLGLISYSDEVRIGLTWFSDGTLTRVMEKLDQMVKDFHLFEYNKGIETRKWSEDDKRGSKDFIQQNRRIDYSLD